MADATQKPLIFNDWNSGMADSPDLGVGLLQNASIDTIPGALMPQYAPQQMSPVASSSAFTWNSGTNLGTITGSFPALVTGNAVQLTTTGSLPSGFSAATTYFIIKISPTTFQLASTLANALGATPISTSTNGSGTNTMATINFGTAMHSIMNPSSGYVFTLDSNGQLWYAQAGSSQLLLVAGQTTTAAAGNGLCGFQTSDASHFYIFVYRNNAIDVLNATNNTALQDPVGQSSWTTGWQTMNAGSGSGAPHHSLLGQDNIVYFTDTRYVGSILEKPGQVFVPGTSSTYTYNNQALRLPAGEQATWLEQLAIQLLIGGGTYNYIYPWDRSSISFTFPWLVPENSIQRLKNIGNVIYILAGARGNIYKSQGYSVVLAKKLPEWITQSTTSTQVAWGGIGFKGGALLAGAGNSNSQGIGVWSLMPDLTSPFMYGTAGKLALENQLINGSAITSILVPATQGLTTSQEFYFIGGAGEFSSIGLTRYSSLGTTVYQSGIRAVGSKVNKQKYSRMEIQLNQPGVAGNQIRIKWRNASVGSWNTMTGGTTNGSFTTDGTVTSFTQDIGLHDLENIQLQVELAGSQSGANALQLMSVILYP